MAYVVEDAAILSRELEATTSTRVRQAAIDLATNGPGPISSSSSSSSSETTSSSSQSEGRGNGGGGGGRAKSSSSKASSSKRGAGEGGAKGSDERSRLVKSMVGLPVARWVVR